MSVVDPIGPIRDDSWPFHPISISPDTTEPRTEPFVLPELCFCDTPVAVTRLDTLAESPYLINCKVAMAPTDILETVLKVTVVGNVCGPTESTPAVGVGTVSTYPTPGTVPPSGCPGITGPIVLHFNEQEVVDNCSHYQPLSGVPYDPANYPGMTSVRFRATLVKNGAFTVQPAIRIVDENGTVYLTPTLTYDANSEAHIDEAITLHANTAHTYYIDCTKTGSGAFQIAVPTFWIFLTDSDQALFQIPAFVSESFVTDAGGLIHQTSTPALAYRPFYGFPQVAFEWDADPYGWGDVDYLEIYIVADPNTDSGLIALFDKTTDTMVTGTEFTVALGDTVNAELYTLQFSPSLLTDGHTYEFRGKSAALYIISGSLFVKVGNGSTLSACRGEVYCRTSVFDCETFFMSRGFTYNASDWPATTVFYFDVTGDWFFAFAGETLNLVDTGTLATPINPPTVITSVSLTASWDHQRSASPITLTDGHIYSVTSGVSTTPTNDRGAYILALLPEP